MGKMARQQKYTKARNDAVRARLHDIKNPDNGTAERRKETSEKLKSVSAPSTKSTPDRANNSARKPDLEHVMDYSHNPKTNTWHEVVQTGDGINAPVHTRLTPKKEMK